ncbi:DNA-binding protein [Tissierella sp. MB52-C2]|uniref:DNA-binding protein n=1 Tax=Tissierella sp. MB52-C2 TaxID=3070999 RepID=UPI00280B3257|nr:DNA-binding protein [Tissierella sp. MB52-C2]WMM24087.1 DNA-binding protein [Tissierella sp. MB52-C2]
MDFYFVEDVMRILRLSKSKSYKVMQNMNKELKEKGYFTIAGRVPKKYFQEKFYFEEEGSKSKRKIS